MKYRKLSLIWLAGALCAAGIPFAAYAKTTAIEQPDGAVNYYCEVSFQDEKKTDQKSVQAARQRLKEELAYLEKYGVSCDAQDGGIYYQGRRVRFVIDEQKLLGCLNTYQSAGTDGEKDIFTIRDENGVLTGVREASPEEFAQQTEEMEKVDADPVCETTYSDAVACRENTGERMDGLAEEASDETALVSSGEVPEDQREQQYEAAGIKKGDSGFWLWKGEPVYFLLDDDGSVCMSNTSGTKEKRICLYVSRDADGEIESVKEVSGEEIVEKIALKDKKNH